MWRDYLRRIPTIGFFFVEIGEAGPGRRGAHSSWLRKVESYLKDGVSLGDGQTEAEGVPSQGGRGDALLRRMARYLT